MMKTLNLLAFLILSGSAFGQTVYVDPAVAGATAAHSAVINSQLNATNERLTLIERGQLAITGNLTIVNTMQDKIYKGLSEVSSILTNLSNVQEIARIATGISSDLSQVMDLAGENPALLLFAERNATLFQQRATSLALEVSSFVLKGGENNLMDAGERSKLINQILTEMVILRSNSYGMYRAMYFAQMKGFVRALNPFQGYINVDIQLAQDIARKAKTLQP
ncbi:MULTISPECIES: hypothetical protein [unclassified Algoriphagus]|jgi:hypothetical protein|uniref:hypothetical protein n=2 Tax=Algoriphagus TaxID=246875 RepID=UPI00257C619D|nr:MULTISPECIES: hypothetical protein [unclassified Algoriphagus]|tara:strand:- start:1143 stop:1808 length:666 start_codon:yes stop_codon:yes gene_type:complete